MKKIKLLFAFLFAILTYISAQEYPKVILTGDYPDPSIIREGKDYYMTHSSIYYTPGFLIWHSQDLINWEPICRVMPEYQGAIWAPDLVKYKNRYYIYYPAQGTNWVIWSNDIRGTWSKPIDLKIGGIDPGHITDESGNRYLYLNEGNMIRLTDDGLATVGEVQAVYKGWQYPKFWETECMCLESPKLNYHNGYYYLTSAQGGTAGPATSHMVTSARSKTPVGPWENSPYNPIVHTYSSTDNWWSKGHGTLIDDVNGNWWIVYHAYAKGYHTLGRSTLIEPIEWTEDGWFQAKTNATPIKADMPISHGLELSDDFIGPDLGLQWTFWKEYTPRAITLENQTLWIKGKGDNPADGRLLLTTATDKNYEVQVEINVEKGNKAGFMLYYNEKAYAGIQSDDKNFIIYKDAKNQIKTPNKFGKKFIAKIQNQGNTARISVSKNGKEWIPLIENLDVSQLHHNNFKGFCALRICLLSAGKGRAGFRHFRYRNAVPQEKDMTGYLMVYHKDESHCLYMATSRDGYTFTALNDGKPVVAADTIAEQKGIRDPHIYRGPDGAFYITMTDMHALGQKAGVRKTEFERNKEEYGWGNNRGLVLMKSWDLINWKHFNIRIDNFSAGFAEIGSAWAPEVTYDEKEGKLMVYFAIRFKNETLKMYYMYVNDEFNQIESFPKILFEYPDEKIAVLDGDITKIGNQYYMFYAMYEGNNEGGGLRLAISDRINGDYKTNARWYDFVTEACEAPNVWKRLGEDKWVLMYDVFGVKPGNFAFCETEDFVHFKNLGYFNEGVMKTTNFTSPKHGAIIHLTKEEIDNLEKFWNSK